MKCSQGDLARIIYSVRPENIGRIVRVKEYIGHFQEGNEFEFRSIPCKCFVTDHYWWIEAEDLSLLIGPSPRAYIADSWLQPITPEDKSVLDKEVIDIAA
jgi:hypothetical protein